jgi:uncharacterized protein
MITRRYYRLPKDHCFIFGPRGTGKSTWIKQNLPQAWLINLLDEETFRMYSADPGRIKSVVAANPNIRQYVIDEVQKVPKILDSIHELIETYKTHQFILTGSSARKLRRGGVNLLGGRAQLTHFHPFMATELGDNFELDFSLENGLIPLIIDAREPQKKIAAYIGLYLKEEVQVEGLVRDVGVFSRFLEAISFSHGSILNLNNIARECHVSRKVIENYISILEDLLLAYKLPVFTRRAKRDYIVHPKFYLFDAGIYYHLRPKGPLDSVSELNGIALEGLVLQHLKAWSDYSSKPAQCYFWRTRGGAEVDFIIYGEEQFYALEVKNSTHVHATDLRSLKTFCEDYPEASPLLVYRGKEKLMIDNIPCWPVTDFLKELIPNHWPVLKI